MYIFTFERPEDFCHIVADNEGQARALADSQGIALIGRLVATRKLEPGVAWISLHQPNFRPIGENVEHE